MKIDTERSNRIVAGNARLQAKLVRRWTWTTKARKARLAKIKTAQRELEEKLLHLRSMFEPNGDSWRQVSDGFASLYYLVGLAKHAPRSAAQEAR